MSIRTKCEGCGKQYSLKDELAGRKIRCPNCKQAIAVPGTPVASTKKKPPVPMVKKPARDEQSEDPNATAKLTPQVRKQTPKGKQSHKTVCPSCGKAIQIKQSTCPHCDYNIKLKRKMGISSAIRSASLEPGVRADGSRYVTRKEKVAVRVEQGKKIRKGLYIAPVLLVALIVGGLLYINNAVYWGPSLKARRASTYDRLFKEGKPLSRLKYCRAYSTGLNVDLTIEAAEVRIEDTSGMSEAEPIGEQAWSQRAEELLLPYSIPDKALSEVNLRHVFVRIKEIESTFSPAKLEKNFTVPEGLLIVWRKAGEKTEQGFLEGAVLDFGSSTDAIDSFSDKLKKFKKAKARLQITGILTFIASNEKQLKAPYSLVLQSGMKRLPGPKESISAGKKSKNELYKHYFFHPVIVVKEHKFIK